ncbi:MAG: hypothetical protein ACJ77A_11750 [Actinomycetota bacterium]
MGMHLEPDPSGKREFNDNELEEQDVERQVHEVHDERLAEEHPEASPSFWRRLFGRRK